MDTYTHRNYKNRKNIAKICKIFDKSLEYNKILSSDIKDRIIGVNKK